MNKIKVLAFLPLVAVTSATSFAATFPDADGSHDLASSTAWNGNPPTDNITVGNPGTYYLGADLTISGTFLGPAGGSTVYDFTSGDHTLTVNGVDGVMERGDDTSVEYRGGKWRASYNPHRWSLRTRATMLFNGVDFQGKNFNFFGYAQNSQVILTNRANVVSLWNGGNLGYLFGTTCDNVVRVMGGSTLQHDKTLHVGYGKGELAERRNNRLIVSGAGSQFVVTGTEHFHIGTDQGGNAVVVEDGGYLKAYNLKVGGAAEINANGTKRPGNDTAGGNSLTVAGTDSVVQLTQGSYLGFGESHSNAIYVLDHASLNVGNRTGGSWAALAVGKGPSASGVASSYNSIVVSNASLVARQVILGEAAGSHDNRLEFLGASPELCLTENEVWTMFGAGNSNIVHVGAAADFSFLAKAAKFGSGCGVGNRMVVDGGSVCTFLSLDVTNGGEVVVGTGSTLTAREGFLLTDGSRLAVSNGTVSLSDAYNRDLNLGDDSTLVLSGDSPKVCSAVTGKGYFLKCGNGTLRFELSENSLAEAPLKDVVQLQHEDGFRYEIVGIEKLQKNLKKSATFTLVETTCDTGLLWTRERSEILEALNASLPEGCSVRIEHELNGKDKMLLKVRSLMGLCIVVR